MEYECKKCERLKIRSLLIRHRDATYSCKDDKKECYEIKKKIKYNLWLEEVEIARKREIDFQFKERRRWVLDIEKGTPLRVDSYFLNEPWVEKRFSFSRNQIYIYNDGGIYDDNNKFLDLNIHEVHYFGEDNWRGEVKMIIPIRHYLNFSTHDFCYDRLVCHEEAELSRDGYRRLSIDKFYYNKKLHRACKKCYEFKQSEKRKTAAFLALINTQRSKRA